jgi:bifunctional non-homologous end joining protein LigD
MQNLPNFAFPHAAAPSALPATIRLAVASSSARPPEGDGWLHEVKYDGYRIAAAVDGRGGLRLITRNGYDRIPLFRAPFSRSADLRPRDRARRRDRGARRPRRHPYRHLQDALDGRRPVQLAYFAFDLLHLEGHDLRRCPIEERKALLRQVLDDRRCSRLVYVDHIVGRGTELFEHVRAIGAEGIVSKRAVSRYVGGETRDWRKTKCHTTGRFILTGFQELGPGRLEALHVAEDRDGELVAAGQVRFGFAGKGLWATLDELRACPVGRNGVVPVEPCVDAPREVFRATQGRCHPRWRADCYRSAADAAGRAGLVVRHRCGDRGDECCGQGMKSYRGLNAQQHRRSSSAVHRVVQGLPPSGRA